MQKIRFTRRPEGKVRGGVQTCAGAFAATMSVIAVLVGCGGAAAQSYPTKPLRLVAPFDPGGPTDIMARMLAQQVSPTVGQQVIVENRPGAGGSIGAENAAKSPADGYTLLLGTASTLAMAPPLYPKLGYATADFAPVGLFADAAFMVVVNASVPANTLKEFIALAKAKPGSLSYGSAGVGNILHVSGELFKSMTGTNLLHVPYKGGAPARAGNMGVAMRRRADRRRYR